MNIISLPNSDGLTTSFCYCPLCKPSKLICGKTWEISPTLFSTFPNLKSIFYGLNEVKIYLKYCLLLFMNVVFIDSQSLKTHNMLNLGL